MLEPTLLHSVIPSADYCNQMLCQERSLVPAHHHPSVNTAYWNYHCSPFVLGVSLVAQLVKNPPAMQEIQVRSLGQEDPLEKETATCSSILAWKIPWTEEFGRLQSTEVQKSWI